MKVGYGNNGRDPSPTPEPELSPALEAQRTSTGLRSRRRQVRILLGARICKGRTKRTWRKGLAHLSDKQEVGGSNPPVRTVAMVQDQGAGL